MCLVVFAWRHAPGHRLLLMGNRDEFLARPTASMGWWPGGTLLAGRDLEAGGTWMALTRSGRFALVTNVRDPAQPKPTHTISRGLLVAAFCGSDLDPQGFARTLTDSDDHYAGYNLLMTDGDTMVCHSNRYGTHPIEPGIHGLSNAAIDGPWPKVSRGIALLDAALDADDDRLLDSLSDDQPAADGTLPDTGVGIEWERRLSSLFVRAGDYGTRATSVVRITDDHRCSYAERAFDHQGQVTGTHAERFDILHAVRGSRSEARALGPGASP
jgi:uncharacterized protein with NRDE domain